jgi:hypothetical protein
VKVLDLSSPSQGPVVDICKDRKEVSGSTKVEKFFHQLTRDSASNKSILLGNSKQNCRFLNSL